MAQRVPQPIDVIEEAGGEYYPPSPLLHVATPSPFLALDDRVLAFLREYAGSPISHPDGTVTLRYRYQDQTYVILRAPSIDEATNMARRQVIGFLWDAYDCAKSTGKPRHEAAAREIRAEIALLEGRTL